jgi:hypothetical protein
MKVLVVGSLPPPLTERSRSLLAAVLRYRREGAEVCVLSPSQESVAHENLAMSGPMSTLEIARAARGADIAVVQLEPGIAVDEFATRAGRAIGLGGLTLALRRAGCEVVLRLHSLEELPLGVGGRAARELFSLAGRIEVGSDETGATLAAAFGSEVAKKIVPSDSPVDLGDRREEGAGESSAFGSRGPAKLAAGLSAEPTLESVTALVRSRAAAVRARLVFVDQREPAANGVEPALALWEWAPRPGLGVPRFVSDMSTTEPDTGSPARRAARALLVAAEDRPLTRPLARGVRAIRRWLANI